MIRRVPSDFVLGATTAAYQVEGGTELDGRLPAEWDHWYDRPGSSFDGRSASDFYHHYREDIAHCRQYNIRALGISIAWTRIIRDEQGTVNEAGVKFYSDVIDCCLEQGIEPYVALYHFDSPKFIFDQGEWLAPHTGEQFLHYARICFEQFGSRVKHWITMKDPVSLVVNEYVTGLFPPARSFQIGQAVHALHKLLVAHARTVNLYKSMDLPGSIGLVHRAEAVYPLAGSVQNERAAELDDAFTNRFLLDAVLAGNYSSRTLRDINTIMARDTDSFAPAEAELATLREAAERLDFLGINYYTSHFCEAWDGVDAIQHNAEGRRGSSSYALHGVSRRLAKHEVPTTDWDWSIFPHGLYDMLLRIHEDYPAKPLYVTENGLGLHEPLPADGGNGVPMVEDDDRIDYIRQHLSAVLDAREEGVDVRGYFVWSMLDAMSWTNGYAKRYGLFFVDYASQQRYPKKSACWFRDLAKSRIMLTVDALSSSVLAP